ncbi:phage baseplate plug family protein [Yersinia pseudotuberculosis]|uniref:phage baseplate plug family protein n=1 Tax=Yersinia pseudotuberculosis TaxID=633 RepID=UPI00403D766A
MIQLIGLESVANQSLTIRLENSRYEIVLNTLNDDLLSISIFRNGLSLVKGIRAMPYTLFLPKHLQLNYGNFILIHRMMNILITKDL